MFGDITILTIWVSLNIAIMMVTMFLWYISRLSSEGSRQESTVSKK
jgi:flagellar biogenesis protein FliO